MPIYEYRCPECGRKSEQLQYGLEVIPICHECERYMDKVISVPALKFIGGGWTQREERAKNDLDPAKHEKKVYDQSARHRG